MASTCSTTVGPTLIVTPGRSSAPEAINFSRNAFACSTDEIQDAATCLQLTTLLILELNPTGHD
jgi:hypothetical protein